MDDQNQNAYAEIIRQFLENIADQLSQAIGVPFDLENTLSPLLGVFGDLGDGPDIGKWAMFKGGMVRELDGTESEMSPMVGIIVGQNHGRIIISEADGVYLGWLRPEHFDLIQVHIPENQIWMN